MKSILFIVNKKAGIGEKKSFPSLVKNVIDGQAFSHEITFTAYRGHATALAKAAVEKKTDIIVAVGGDGSVNEIAGALVGTSSALAVVPGGSGNGFARALGIPINTEKALSLLLKGRLKPVDVGRVNDHFFFSNAGLGFDALIADLFADKKRRGLFNYSRLVIRALRNYEPLTYRISIDAGEVREKALFVAVANGNQFGYNFKIAPDASMDDGVLNVCIMKPLRWWHLPVVSIQALTGSLAGNSHWMKHLYSRKVVIAPDRPITRMQLDGEPVPLEAESVQIDILPRALQVLVP